MESQDIPIDYNPELETLLAGEGEKALGLRWCHDKAERINQVRNTYFTIPAIALSTLAGAGTLGTANLFPFEGATTLIGIISLSVGLINTLASFFTFSKKAEAHRIASLQYARLYRLIRIELAVPRNQRRPATELLKQVKEDIDRLTEISPQLPQSIISLYQEKFRDCKDISHSEILNGLEPINIYNGPPPTPITRQPSDDAKHNIKITIHDKKPTVGV
jgi:hypothetical protein